MTKVELINQVAAKTGITKKDAGACVEAFLSVIEDALGAGEKVQPTGFGGFEVRSGRPAWAAITRQVLK